jgi:hypothetical protein
MAHVWYPQVTLQNASSITTHNTEDSSTGHLLRIQSSFDPSGRHTGCWNCWTLGDIHQVLFQQSGRAGLPQYRRLPCRHTRCRILGHNMIGVLHEALIRSQADRRCHRVSSLCRREEVTMLDNTNMTASVESTLRELLLRRYSIVLVVPLNRYINHQDSRSNRFNSPTTHHSSFNITSTCTFPLPASNSPENSPSSFLDSPVPSSLQILPRNVRTLQRYRFLQRRARHRQFPSGQRS